MQIKIITDSTADLSPELAARYGIEIASLEVIMDGVAYRALDVAPADFYAHLGDCLKNGKRLPTTSQVNPAGFLEILEPYANKEDVFVFILPIAKEMSGTHRSAEQAIEMLDMKNVHLFDTHVTTFGLGALVLEIAKLAEQGLPLNELIQKAEDLNRRVWIYVSIGDLRCLHAGGRLTSASMKLGTLLKINPIVYIDGKVEVVQKVLGRSRATKWIVDRVCEERDESMPLYFGNAEGEDIVDSYRTRHREALALTGKEPNLTMGPVVATHSGPSCAGIAFFRKK